MMSENNALCRYVVEKSKLPPKFPTHLIDANFWELLGRTVGSFGYLEEVLARAVFALTGTRKYDDVNINDEFQAWLQIIETALSDTLGSLIDKYGRGLSP